MSTTGKTLVGLLATAILGFICGHASAAVMTVSVTDPTVDGADIAQLAGTTDPGGDLGHAWSNRPVHGQTFTTGADPLGYQLSSVSMKARVDQANTTSPDWTTRVGTVVGTDFNMVATEMATGVTIPQAFPGGSGPPPPQWVTWTFDTPISLDPNTLYAFDVDPSGNGFISLNNGGDVYVGGTAFTSGSGGTPANPITQHAFDRAFHVDLEAIGAPRPPASGGGYADVVAADSPVVWYRFDEAPGATAISSIGSAAGYDADLVNSGHTFAVPSVSAELGTAVDLGAASGSSGGVTNGAHFLAQGGNHYSTFLNNGPASLEFWINTTQTDGASSGWNNPSLMGEDNSTSCCGGSGGDSWWGMMETNAAGTLGTIGINTGNQPVSIATSVPINEGDWHHVVITRDASNAVSIYLDGFLDTTGAFANTGYTFNALGRGSQNQDSHLDAMIDEVAIYDSVLGTHDVARHFAAAGPDRPPYDEAVLADSPIAYYRFSETSGTAAVDEIGGPPGTYIGAANLGAAGPMPPDFPGLESGNSATGFNNTDAAVNTPVSLSGLEEFTIEAWARPTAAQGGRTGLVGQNDAIEFGFISANTIQMWNPGIGALNVTYDSGANADEWIHLVGVGTGTEKQIWINGVLAGTQTHAATTDYGTSGFTVNIGGDGIFDGGGNWFNGDIDEVALYNTALSGAQIQGHYLASLKATQVIPEPSTLALAGIGLLGLGLVGRRRRTRAA